MTITKFYVVLYLAGIENRILVNNYDEGLDLYNTLAPEYRENVELVSISSNMDVLHSGDQLGEMMGGM